MKCYDPFSRNYVPCGSVYPRPSWKPNYALCGEHDRCTVMDSSNNLNFTHYETVPCVDWKEPKVFRTQPFLRKLTHDDELRVCS